jgi:hypothetical protein
LLEWKFNMNARCHNLRIAAIGALVLALLALVACGTAPATSPAPAVLIISGTPVGIDDRENQAAATAEIERANAMATLNSANATLSAAQIQQQNSADVIAAQKAAEAAIVRANAQATLVAANSTQNAAQTQDAIRQTQEVIAAGTQTAVANLIATQTQSALATSQSYADQSRQLQQQSQNSIAFLWIWCLPAFIVLLAGLVLWGLWRRLKIRQANQVILVNPGEKLPPPMGDVIDSRFQLTKPVDQARRWLDEVKRKLRSSDKKNEDDHTDN